MAIMPDTQSLPGQERYYAASYPQRKEWVIAKLNPKSSFHIQKSYWYPEVDIAILEQSICRLVARHESLRTTFVRRNGVLLQCVKPYKPDLFVLRHLDISAVADEELEISGIALREEREPFDLENGPLLRAILIKRQANSQLIFTIHHVVADIVSLEIIEEETTLLYNALSLGEPDPLPPPTYQYKDYTEHLNARLYAREGEATRQYWHNRFAGTLPLLSLTPRLAETEQARQAANRQLYLRIGEQIDALGLTTPYPYHGIWSRLGESEGAMYRCRVEGGTLPTALNRQAQQHQTTLFSVFASYLYLTLYALSKNPDSIIDIPVSTRDDEACWGVVGWLTSGINCRVTVDPTLTIGAFTDRVAQTIQDDMSHKSLPIEEILEAVQAPIEYMVQTQLNFTDQTQNPFSRLHTFHTDHHIGGQAYFDLRFGFMVCRNGIEIEVYYKTALFDRTDIEHFINKYLSIVDLGLTQPHLPVGALLAE